MTDTPPKRAAEPPYRSCLSWFIRGIGAAVILILVLAVVGFIFQSTAESRLLERFPPPGERVPLQSDSGQEYRLHLFCSGPDNPPEGSPTVLLSAAAGGWSLDWNRVQSDLSNEVRVCSYDRTGYGWSDPGPEPRTSLQITQELEAALEQAGVSGPYLPVGHSFGGHTARLFYSRHTDQITGMLLVDVRHEDLDARLPEYRNLVNRGLASYRVLSLLGRFGALYVVRSFVQPPDYIRDFPPDIQEQYIQVGYRPKYFDALAGEISALDESDEQVRQAGGFGDLPLIVITHGIADWIPQGYPIAERPEAEQLWQELQRQIVALSTDSQLTVAEESGHAIPQDQPQIVIDAVRQLLNR